MGRLLAPLAACALLITLVHAGIEFIKPAGGALLDAGEVIDVAWSDEGPGPAIADLATYELYLCMGGTGDTMVS
jgi:hypothetical protein